MFLSIIWLADFQGFLLPVVTISNSSYKAKEESQTEWVGKAEVAVFGNLISEVTSITLAEFQTLEANHQAQPTLKRRGLFRGRNARRQGSLFSFFLCFSTVVIDHYLFKNWEIWERGAPQITSWFSDLENSWGSGTQNCHWLQQKVSKQNQQQAKTREIKLGGGHAQASQGPLPAESHETHSVPLAPTATTRVARLSTKEAHLRQSFHWGPIMWLAYAKIPGPQKEGRGSA